MQKITNRKVYTAILVGVRDSTSTIKELESLLKTLGIRTEFVFLINRYYPTPSHYLTKGKLNELIQYKAGSNIDLIAFDDELKFSQIRNLQKKLQIPVLDRPRIILEIFARRATTREGKIQVEIATLQRRKAELIHSRSSLDQQAGFIGGKGPGEKKIELNRRQLFQHMKSLRESLRKIEKQRNITRNKRKSSSLFTVSLVGYTNAGKSTLFNLLTKDNTPTDNLLFHTLDIRTRRGFLNNSIGEILYNDTVGFIRKLPHELIEAFKSTLEEILLSDLIVIVVDASDKHYSAHLTTVQQTLKELGAAEIPFLLVFNKIDLLTSDHSSSSIPAVEECKTIYISAKDETGIDSLKQAISEKILSL